MSFSLFLRVFDKLEAESSTLLFNEGALVDSVFMYYVVLRNVRELAF